MLARIAMLSLALSLVLVVAPLPGVELTETASAEVCETVECWEQKIQDCYLSWVQDPKDPPVCTR